MIRILTADDIRQAITMADAIEAMKGAFTQLSTGKAYMPLRTSIEIPQHNGLTLFMPAYLSGDDEMAVKIVSVFNDNPSRGLPIIQALVVVVDAATGEALAIMDGTYLTAFRTGAASGAATDFLAREDSRCVAIFGAGVQGRTQLEAVCAVRSIQEAWIYDLVPERACDYASEMSGKLSLKVHTANDPGQALQQADIICTATTSSTPVFEDVDVKAGTHINAIGAYTVEMQEIPSKTVGRSKVIIDHWEACMAEAGDLLIPLKDGLITEFHIFAELGEIAAGIKPGRVSPEEITLFKSVGVAIQDVAVANLALKAAEDLNLGTEFDL
jgi:alanine dehydrogenase